MSRVGKKPIPLSEKIKIKKANGVIEVSGAKGTLTQKIPPGVEISVGESEITVAPLKNDRQHIALQGLTRSLVANMVTGVNSGFERKLEINGIGYRAETSGSTVVFNLGYSHPINFELPDGVTAAIEKNVITLSCIDKAVLGQTAAAMRSLRPPEPYKGKGVKYAEERIQRKAGKTGTK